MNVQVGMFQFNSHFFLGEGAYGKVFLGQDNENNEQVTIKQIDTKFIEDTKKMQSFQHTPKYIYIGYCKDVDLLDLFNQKRLTELELFEVLRQIIEGFKQLQKHSIAQFIETQNQPKF